MDTQILAIAPLWYVAFLFSTVCHEAAHALVAKLGGDDTAYVGGQVSLDPIPHIRREPFGLVVVPLIMLFTGGMMIGWGSAPFNPYWQIRFPRRAALMALAGPMSNFSLAIIAGSLIHLAISVGVFVNPGEVGFPLIKASSEGIWEGAAAFLEIFFFLNVLLGVFNLLPIPPLDGYSVLGLLLPEQQSLKLTEFARSPMLSFIGILLAWKIFPLLAQPVIAFARNALFSAFF
jgi:Zn-dependent protease